MAQLKQIGSHNTRIITSTFIFIFTLVPSSFCHAHTHAILSQDPELLEIFNIRLLNVTGGATLSSAGDTVATVTIQANDYPYGLFVFSSSFRPLVVGEWEGEVEVRVSREFGTVGEVTVEFQTIISDEVASSSALTGINVEQLIANRFAYVCVYVCTYACMRACVHVYVGLYVHAYVLASCVCVFGLGMP